MTLTPYTTVMVKRLEHAKNLPLPSYATFGSAGMDLCAAVTEPVILKAYDRALIPTGLQIALPSGFELQIRPRSGLAFNYGITLLNTPGTIDEDYRGEIKVVLINTDHNSFIVERGMRIAQAILIPVVKYNWCEVENLDATERSCSGFGSTGI
ncbi:Deoxyuridine 5'-triphosphate nucleotidohydrolase [Commensalibacter sp. Nvir]|uniref:dUTP diphosphatase n=1 Tax=Commensalibacter sp. Nvir TaxID=3069817 RepID=UPI002D3C8236|nr:Deoxyuridine 5'-triphosphate nucleotidohydrolase [Commensalibacter sp. Nvir]